MTSLLAIDINYEAHSRLAIVLHKNVKIVFSMTFEDRYRHHHAHIWEYLVRIQALRKNLAEEKLT